MTRLADPPAPRVAKAGTPPAAAARVLIVGYGNTLRGDDAAGALVAAAIEALELRGVAVLVCPQLTPESSEMVAAVESVIFIDAGAANERPVEVREIVEDTGGPVFGHAIDPRSVLAWARGLFGRSPRAWLVTIAARSFELGAGPSPDCAAGVALAVEVVKGLCGANTAE